MLNIWDTPGQELYRSVVKIYYRNVQAVVLVVSLEKAPNTDAIIQQLKGLEFWLLELRESNFEEYIAFTLLGNKVDMVNETSEPCDEVLLDWCQ